MHTAWDHTVDGHRTAQREAIAAAAWALAQQHGPFAVTMSQVAAAAGVSRPTLYKYFPDVQSMLIAHHRKHVETHVAELEAIVSGPGLPGERLEHLVGAYAEICHHRARQGDAEVDRLVHSPAELDAAESQLVDLFAQAIREAGQRRQRAESRRPGRLRRTRLVRGRGRTRHQRPRAGRDSSCRR